MPETLDRGLVQYHLGHRCQFHPRQFFYRALAFGVKPACTIQHVAKQVKPHRATFAGGKQINQAAANGVIPRLHHCWRLVVAHAHKKFAQSRLVNLFANGGGKTGISKDFARRNPLCRGVYGGQQQERPRKTLRQSGQRCHATSRNVVIGRNPVIGQAIPCRKDKNRQVRREELRRLADFFQPFVIARDMHNRPRPFAQQFGQQMGVKAFGRATNGDFLMRGHVCHGKASYTDFPRHRKLAYRTVALRLCHMPQNAVMKIDTMPIT